MLSLALLIGGSHKALWQYTSLPDVLKIVALVTVALVLAVAVSFLESRLEGVARSVPVIQWFLLISVTVGTRMAFRVWHERARRDRWVRTRTPLQHAARPGHCHSLLLRPVARGDSVVSDLRCDRFQQG